MATATNVTTGKPGVNGAVYVASSSTASLPTSTTATLTGFNSLGYISEDGIENDNSFASTDVKEWGGASVLTIENDYNDTFKFTLLEALNVDVLKEVFGSANVSGDLSTGITVSVKPTPHETKKWVFDMVMRNGVLKRICIPAASISAVEAVSYKNDGAVGYAITLSCMADASGHTHYEYIK